MRLGRLISVHRQRCECSASSLHGRRIYRTGSVGGVRVRDPGLIYDRLKALDNTTKVLRQSAKAPQRAPSVSGIGTVVEKPDYSEAKIVVAMVRVTFSGRRNILCGLGHPADIQVGLPARGKSYLSNRLMRYLRVSNSPPYRSAGIGSLIVQWLEFNVDVFNVGQLRRSKARAEEEGGGSKAPHTADYFSHSNAKAKGLREKLAEESLESLISWLKKEGNVGIMGEQSFSSAMMQGGSRT